MFTQFWDMHSGGSQKEEFAKCYIEAPENEAKIIFYNRFGHNPERVTCTCCGEDYSISESETLEEATAYHRNCNYVGNSYVEEKGDSYRDYLTLEKYINQDDVCVIYAKDITEDEKRGDVPSQGYVWID